MTDNPLNQPLNSSGGHNIKYNYEKNHIDKPVVLVFPVSEDSSTLSDKSLDIIAKIQGRFGKDSTRLYFSSTKKEAILEVFPKMSEIRAKADRDDFPLLLDKFEVKRRAETGNSARGIAPFKIGENDHITHYGPYDHIFGKYEGEEEFADLYANTHKKHKIPFNASLQLKVTLNLLENKKLVGGLQLDLEKCIEEKSLLAYYPLHDETEVEFLANKWYKGGHDYPWKQPLDHVKDYLGEKTALYFAFLGHYTSTLIPAAFVGVIVQAVIFGHDDFSHPIVPFYSIFVVLWAVYLTETWLRYEHLQAMRWGMTDFEKIDADRPQYRGELRPSLVTGKKSIYFGRKHAIELLIKSFTVIGTLILLIIGATASIYIIRAEMDRNDEVRSNSATIASILNAVQIQIFNFIYGNLATRLTDMENHRTNTQYEDSMIAKVFLFQFVNSYASFAFIAFVAKFLDPTEGSPADSVGQCGSSDCMETLAVNLGIVLIVKLTVGSAQEYLLPHVIRYFSAAPAPVDINISPAERQYALPGYSFLRDGIDEYSELYIQFGYITLFITGLPGATFLALANNHFEIRGDAHKLLYMTRRVFPKGAQDIGTWQNVFEIISTIAVVTNAGIVVFTSTLFDDYTIYFRFWLFIGAQWAIFSIQGILRLSIPDIPHEVQIQMERNEFIVSKLIDFAKDDDDDEEEDGNGNKKTSKKISHDGIKIEDRYSIAGQVEFR